MFKKATFALAGALGIVAAATLSTTAGAAEGSALAVNVTFYELTNFNAANPAAQSINVEATGGCKDTTGTAVDPAKSAELLDPTIQVLLFKNTGCKDEDRIAVLTAAGDSGDPSSIPPGTAALGTNGAKSYKLVVSP